MNMKISINKKLAELCFFILMMFCTNVEAYKDRKFINEEVVQNQQRLMDINNISPTKDSDLIAHMEEPIIKIIDDIKSEEDDDDKKDDDKKDDDKDTTDDVNNNNSTQNETNKTEKKLTFWSGFIDSLSMIFFVEFGDRVIFLSNIDFHDNCVIYNEA